jgi:phosphoribosylamine---glycine ligase
VAWARAQRIHLAVTGPESALEAGVTDALRAAGIAVASPSQSAARIETSKTFMRELMARHRIPGQLAFHPFSALGAALDFIDKNGPRWAVKPVGLTGGKGVQVFGDHFHDAAGAKAYVGSVFAQKAGGGTVQFEELAVGEEYTVMAFTDGTTILPMPAVQDHKRLLDGDKGPNTGGMGSYSQPDGLLPFLSAEEYGQSAAILQAIVDALRAEGTPYVGTIYGQFMLTRDGPRVIEVNARFGDPEAMNVLHLLESDYVALLEGMATGTLAGKEARFRGAATVVKYVVPKGYGQGSPASGKPVEIDEFNVKRTGGTVYMGAIEQMPYGGLETMASRTLAVLGEGPTIEHANAVCEASLRHVHGKELHVRHDIGSAELIAKRVRHMVELRGAATVAR